MQSPIRIEYTAAGYLHIAAAVAQSCFPNDCLVLQAHPNELWLLPTRGAAGGGLLLKQRNPQGDRSVLVAPYLPPDASPGEWQGFWDERAGALRVAYRLPVDAAPLTPGLAAMAVVEPENGRWVVYLEVAFADSIGRRRIADYPTEERARVAAKWIERAADRPLPQPAGL